MDEKNSNPSTPTKERVLEALGRIADPISGESITAAGLVEGVRVHGARAQVILASPHHQAEARQMLGKICESEILKIPGIRQANVVLTAHKPPPKLAARKTAPDLSFTRKIIAVASGKGGVGKSFVAVNLAVALARRGLTIGLLDADIYGPSVPQMLGIKDKPTLDQKKRLIPHKAHGIEAMSLGFLVDPDRAMIWRGPMVHSAITQMLGDVAWNPMDMLIVDMPPGTGDAPLTLASGGSLSGVVLVCTPQEIALADLRRAIAMFRRLEIPTLGIVENMAWYEQPNGERVPIFGEGGAENLAKKENLKLLGALPLNLAAREGSDRGANVFMISEAEKLAQRFDEIAEKLARITKDN